MLAKNTYDLKKAVTGSALERFGQEAFMNQFFFFLETGCKVLEEGTGGCGWMWGGRRYCTVRQSQCPHLQVTVVP